MITTKNSQNILKKSIFHLLARLFFSTRHIIQTATQRLAPKFILEKVNTNSDHSSFLIIMFIKNLSNDDNMRLFDLKIVSIYLKLIPAQKKCQAEQQTLKFNHSDLRKLLQMVLMKTS